MRRVDVIVPCYNEAERVGKVLKVLSSSPYIKKIIVVDDGSTDNSADVAKEFPKTTVIKLSENVGKGGAVKAGLEKVDTDTVFLSDADIRGFKDHHVKALIEEYQKKHGVAIGIPELHITKLPYWLRIKIFPKLDGERVLATKDLKGVVSSDNSGGFGLEAWMNYYFRRKKINPSFVPLRGFSDGPLHGRRSAKNLALEASEIGETYLEIYKDMLQRTLQL